MKEKCKFRMRAGFIINCPAFEGGKIYTNDNLTDAVAEKYLAKFPKNADMFQELPKDFKVKFAKKTTDGDKGGKQGKSKTAVKKAAETTAEAASDNAVKDDTEKTEETVKDEAEKENAE